MSTIVSFSSFLGLLIFFCTCIIHVIISAISSHITGHTHYNMEYVQCCGISERKVRIRDCINGIRTMRITVSLCFHLSHRQPVIAVFRPILMCIMRRHHPITRRVYKVPRSNSLWNNDGHHSLIKWRFVINGGMDGFSRMIVYLHCSTNNLSATMMTLFYKAIEKYGIPSRV